MLNKDLLSKIGIGTWGVGGLAERNLDNNDRKQTEAITYAINKGLNFAELSCWYAEGHAIDIFHQAQVKSQIDRDQLFYFLSIYDRKQPNVNSLQKEIELALSVLDTDYIDSLQLSLSFVERFGFDKIVKLHKWALNNGRSRFVSTISSNLDYLKQFYQVFDGSIFSHEFHFSFEIRDVESLGIINYANQVGIENVIFQPLRRNRTAMRNWQLLNEMAIKYHKTQNQILINWMVSKGLRLLNKSENIEHIDENLAACNFEIDKHDLESLNNFQPANYMKRNIDWFNRGEGTPQYMFPNLFDEWYPKE